LHGQPCPSGGRRAHELLCTEIHPPAPSSRHRRGATTSPVSSTECAANRAPATHGEARTSRASRRRHRAPRRDAGCRSPPGGGPPGARAPALQRPWDARPDRSDPGTLWTFWRAVDAPDTPDHQVRALVQADRMEVRVFFAHSREPRVGLRSNLAPGRVSGGCSSNSTLSQWCLSEERRGSGQPAGSKASACSALFLLSRTLLSKPSVIPKIP
jgi:hypothetical protein